MRNTLTLIIAAFMIGFGGTAEARLGETLAECIDRYGPVASASSDWKEWKVGKFRVSASFQGGKAIAVIYRYKGVNAHDSLTVGQHKEIIKNNGVAWGSRQMRVGTDSNLNQWIAVFSERIAAGMDAAAIAEVSKL